MPNWSEGSLRIKGTHHDVMNFLVHGLEMYVRDNDMGLNPHFKFDVHGYWYLDFPDNYAYTWVVDTQRAFVEFTDNSVVGFYIDDDPDNKEVVIALRVRQAWACRPDDWIAIAKKYNLTIKFWGVERGMGFIDDWVFYPDGKYEGLGDCGQHFASYDDFVWACPYPFLGG